MANRAFGRKYLLPLLGKEQDRGLVRGDEGGKRGHIERFQSRRERYKASPRMTEKIKARQVGGSLIERGLAVSRGETRGRETRGERTD